jgi:hypothetical protein
MRTEFPHDVQGPHQPQPRARPVKSILKPAKGPTTPAPPMTFGGGPSPEPSEDMGVDVGGYDESGYGEYLPLRVSVLAWVSLRYPHSLELSLAYRAGRLHRSLVRS